MCVHATNNNSGVYAILRSTVVEAVGRGLVSVGGTGDGEGEDSVAVEACLEMAQAIGLADVGNASAQLARLASACAGGAGGGGYRSGRALRKLLLVSYTRCAQGHGGRVGHQSVRLTQLIDAMRDVVIG